MGEVYKEEGKLVIRRDGVMKDNDKVVVGDVKE